METFHLEVPTIAREKDAIDYINEHYEYKSKINGAGCLSLYLSKYSKWLDYLDNMKDEEFAKKEEWVPSRTYFFVRDNDNKIIGMVNIRLHLSERLLLSGRHIGYGIRPTERKKGYNNVNLYLALEKCDKFNIQKALLDASVTNIASWKTMEALGGIRTKEYYDTICGYQAYEYEIDVKKALEEHKEYKKTL